MSTALVVFTLIMLAGVLVAEQRGARAGVWVCKPLASLGFVSLAAARVAQWDAFAIAVVGALVLSMAGDVLLIPRGNKKTFLGGLVSFLLGHVLYGVAFVVRGVSAAAVAGALVLLGVLALLVGRWLLPNVSGGMRGPVIAYITVISTMVALAVGSHLLVAMPVFLVAAVAFYASDLAVARERFVKPGFINRLWGLPTYYVAQLLFAWGLG